MEAQPNRVVYGKTLAELGAKNPNIVVLDADISKSTNTFHFARRFPERFFNMGTAEQNMICFAAGLATASVPGLSMLLHRVGARSTGEIVASPDEPFMSRG